MRALAGLSVCTAAIFGACSLASADPAPPGNSDAGATLVVRQSCGSCHQIPRVQQADGMVGPPLGGIAARVYIAGHVLNTPENMIAWLRDPQAIVPGNAMPNTGLSEAEARDIAAFLFTLR